MTKPYVSCPSCWWPIALQPTKELGEHACSNRSCPLGVGAVKMRVFPSEQDASKDRVENAMRKSTVLMGNVKQLFDINEHPTLFWGYFYCTGPLGRFRLLAQRPLPSLLPEDFISDWALGVSQRTGIPFTVFLLAYDRDTGEIIVDGQEKQPILIPIGGNPDPVSPVCAGYCKACSLIRESFLRQKASDPNFLDPCRRSNQELASRLIQYVKANYQSSRLAAVDPSAPATDLFLNAVQMCWLGLTDVAFPIFVADVVVALAFSGQTVTPDFALTPEQNRARAAHLAALHVSDETVTIHFNQMPKVPIEAVERDLWKTLRANAHVLQMLAESRYGQLGTARADLLSNELRNAALTPVESALNQWTALSEIASPALSAISSFFSFRKAALLAEEAGKWYVAATFPKRDSVGESLSENLDVQDTQLELPQTLDTVAEALWPHVDISKPVYSVRADERHLYVFTDRRHRNAQPRTCFNHFCQNLLRESTLIFHESLSSQISVYERIENIRGIVHNLGGPMAEIESAMAKLDAKLYLENVQILTSLPSQFKFIKEALDELSSDIERSKRRIAFEIQKFQRGADLTEYLGRPRKFIPVRAQEALVPPRPPRLGYWNMAIRAFDMYAAEMRCRRILLAPKFDSKGLEERSTEHGVRIDREALRIVTENLVDNAVKYAYNDSEVRLHM